MVKTIRQKTAEAAPSSGVVPIDPRVLEITRSIDLRLEDYPEGVWLPVPYRETPGPRPFVLEECRAVIERLPMKNNYIDWAKLVLPIRLCSQEAHFWLMALSEPWWKMSASALSQHLKGFRYDGQLSMQEALERTDKTPTERRDLALCILIAIFPLTDVISQMIDWSSKLRQIGTLDIFARVVLPFMPETERDELRRFVRNWLAKKDESFFQWKSPLPRLLSLAALLGMQRELLSSIQTIPDNQFDQCGP